LGDIAFPGFVMVLKLVSKLFVEREVSFMDALKAMVVFPIDITFLAFSFGAAILYAIPPQSVHTGSVKKMFAVLIACTILSIVVTALCRKGDKALDQSKFGTTIGWAIVTYGASFCAKLQSLNVTNFVQ
jgi:hypothetical protein